MTCNIQLNAKSIQIRNHISSPSNNKKSKRTNLDLTPKSMQLQVKKTQEQKTNKELKYEEHYNV